MSVISFQCYELRNTADELDEMAKAYKSGHNVLSPMLRDAADTILELRDDLQRATAAVQEAEHDGSMAWDRVRKAECENAKLRELVLCLLTCLSDSSDACDKCPVNGGSGVFDFAYFCDSLLDRMRELGVEVNV